MTQLAKRMLLVSGRPDVLKHSRVGCADLGEVRACLREAQRMVRATPYVLCIVVVLAVVLPEAHRADLVVAALLQGQIAAARTRMWACFRATADIHERLFGHIAHRHTCRSAEVAE